MVSNYIQDEVIVADDRGTSEQFSPDGVTSLVRELRQVMYRLESVWYVQDLGRFPREDYAIPEWRHRHSATAFSPIAASGSES